MNKKQIVLKYALMVVVVGVALCLSVLANMQNIIFPFAIPIAIALVGGGIKSYIVAPLFFIANFINQFDNLLENMLITSNASALILSPIPIIKQIINIVFKYL